jgi:hypothetical protein
MPVIVTPVILLSPAPITDWHESDVAETQLEVLQADSPTRIDEEMSVPPKLRPSTVILASPVVGAFGSTRSVITAASYVNTCVTVPMVLPIITVVCSPAPLLTGVLHVTEVPEVQIEVEHVAIPTWPDGVGSLKPKLLPENVITAPVVEGPLIPLTVATGASKLNTANCVPTDDMSITFEASAIPNPGSIAQVTRVEDIQVAVVQSVDPIFADNVRSTEPKLTPIKVMLSPPELGEFTPKVCEITGESYEKAGYAVPMFFPTSMFTRLAAPAPDWAVQETAVLVDHDVVAQSVVPTCTDGVGSTLPMLKPMTVMLRVEVWAMLPGLMYVITGVS